MHYNILVIIISNPVISCYYFKTYVLQNRLKSFIYLLGFDFKRASRKQRVEYDKCHEVFDEKPEFLICGLSVGLLNSSVIQGENTGGYW